MSRVRVGPIVLSVLLAVALLGGGCALRSPSVAGEAAVAMPDSHAADVAAFVLRRGGNAVDASVAAALALAVTYPEAGNLGGGGFMLLQVDGESRFLDYRETAPSAARRTMYLDDAGEPVRGASLHGHLAVGVPGTVAGLWEAHRRHGTLPWRTLVEPAIALARDGFVVHEQLAERIERIGATYDGVTNFASHWGEVRAGQRFVQPELAATLERIAAGGRDGFYRGETARLIEAEMRRGRGIVSAGDLAAYRPIWREPLRADWRGYEVVSAPLPSSGGFAVIQLLGMKHALRDEFDGLELNSPQYVHLVAEMEKRVFADRAAYLGDPDFVDVPIERLIDPDYIASRAAEVDPGRISRLDDVRPGLDDDATTHFSIVDADGNAVSNTSTLNTWFGSGVVVEGAGFLLNNEMDDFSVKPGVPNYYGVVGGEANAIEPGKRMLSSMAPTILLEDGEVRMVLGTPGGSTIFTTVFQMIVDIVEFGLSPHEAAAAPRFHHQLLPPERVTYTPSRPLPDETIRELTRRGYEVVPHSYEYGDPQIVWVEDGRLFPASDDRWRGVARRVR